MKKICNDEGFANDLKQKGLHQAKKFSPENCAKAVINVYKEAIVS
jgi:glycosyltransferase involved in cell wall biosynthesis